MQPCLLANPCFASKDNMSCAERYYKEDSSPEDNCTCTQTERAAHDKLAIAVKGLEERHASKSDLCKKLEDRRAASLELAEKLAAEVEALKQERSGLSTQLTALQDSHHR